MKQNRLFFVVILFVLSLLFVSCSSPDNTKKQENEKSSTSSISTQESSNTITTPPVISSVSVNGSSKQRIYIYKYRNANLDNYNGWTFEKASHEQQFNAYKKQGFFISSQTYGINTSITAPLDSFFSDGVYPKLVSADPKYSNSWISDANVNITIDSVIAEFGIEVEDSGDSYIVTYYTADGLYSSNFFKLSAEDVVSTQLHKTCVQVTKENVLIYYDTDGKKAPLSQCDRCKHISLNSNTNTCSVCASMSCNCGGPISEHNCNDYPNVVCPNCEWGIFVTGVGIEGIVCPECGTRCL